MLRLFRRPVRLVRIGRAVGDVAEEMEFHRASIQDELERIGMPRTQAFAGSRRSVGNTTVALEDARTVWLWPWVESVYQDLVYAVRALRREAA